MPFDAKGMPGVEADAFALYRGRRERAAAFWRGVPAERFDMDYWECGTRACALGWLAHAGVDGWHWSLEDVPNGYREPVFDPDPELNDDAYEHAAVYFGLSVSDASHCFGPSSFLPLTATPAGVGDLLLSLGYLVLGRDF